MRVCGSLRNRKKKTKRNEKEVNVRNRQKDLVGEEVRENDG